MAISASATSIAERVMHLVGRPDIAEQSWFPRAGERVKHADMIDAPVAEWIGARDYEEVSAAFQDAGAALAPVYDIEQLMNDPHVQEREVITTIDDEDLGPLKMQNLIFRMGGTPGAIRHGGRRLGQDTDSVLDDLLGISGRQARRAAQQRGALMDRSYLFAPGHNAKLLDKVFDAGADAVMLDLEDAVPPGGQGHRPGHGRRGAADRPGLGPGQRRPNRLVRGRPRRGRRARVRHPDPEGGVRRRRGLGHRPRPGQTDHLRHRERPRACSPRRKSPPFPVSASWRWAGSICNAT